MLTAFASYTIAVWGEQYQKELKPVYVVLFCLGVACDTMGTTMMAVFQMDGSTSMSADIFQMLFHVFTGLGALLLMMIHAIWALMVLLKKDQESEEKFHRFSRWVWFFWLIPFLSGEIFAIFLT